jgi:hypothetical protein
MSLKQNSIFAMAEKDNLLKNPFKIPGRTKTETSIFLMNL